MTTSLLVINDLNTYFNRFKKVEADLKKLLNANRGRKDLIDLPQTPKQCGVKEEKDASVTESDKEQDPEDNEEGQQALMSREETP